ncbi:hypothetical protein BJ878DRAFT_485940 [Calycina marina]|uniref:N-acetyltransferase domain-containing protein n=1 Tax=Calycina marina TaxID=1763456 RepID=A0A9P8CJE3_9HELO|nr:hypothetical protein BJ878DRAFT_485940 [Calycina marina]
MIAYSNLVLDPALAKDLKKKWGTDVTVESAEKLKGRDPVGLNDPLAEKMSADVRGCHHSILGDRRHVCMSSEPHISLRSLMNLAKEFLELSLLCTLPAHRGAGLASQRLAWATKLADNAKLHIWLEASPMSVSLYKRFDFVIVGEVESDLSIESSTEDGTYVHTCMLREPGKSD